MDATICDWCHNVIKPGDHFVRVTVDHRVSVVGGGWAPRDKEQESIDLHCDSLEKEYPTASPMTCYQHYFS